MVTTVRGPSGSIRRGYAIAVAVTGWTVTKAEDGSGWSLSAGVVNSNAYWVTQRPLAFVVTHQRGMWRWPVIELQIANGMISASLGSPEKD